MLLLHVGCGHKRRERTTRGFQGDEWQELRLDIDPSVAPDILGSMTDMSGVAGESVDAVFSSHNLEHLFPHEVPVAMAEFLRVLRPTGFAVATCPDLQAICALVAEDKLLEPAYVSPAGPITPLDMLYGHRASIAAGNIFMAHRCGFTLRALTGSFLAAGFASVAGMRRGAPHYDLWVLATRTAREEALLRKLAAEHFPQ